ncbi:glycosyltransferase family 2 protein [Clostridium folliculivorans]|uniref:Sugar transferase n=1 Tax=Clostridium folliculivorans TaxID=2886038 RepID=A0A9W6DCE5_9CLOT|nr:glycosyltransferase family 2 protein [Clostridium folliculivorans]GKU26912.1 sugar transferase [Clostridium folliculivorans]GKU31563.1 sugar transferase [Clostridium folliculivorans]
MIKDITVFTPTYNRGELLTNLYESLIKQTYKNFEWIIYDDGSIDNTEQIVEKLKADRLIEIIYVKSANMGKHVAMNKGADIAKGELFFVVDSDDILTEDALKTIVDAWNSIPVNERSEYSGIGALKGGFDKKSITKTLNEQFIDANYIDFSFYMGYTQDKAEIYVTEIFKKYKFPVFEGENFMTEIVVFLKIAEQGYKMRWVNKVVYQCEYKEDGLSKNSFKVRLKNINGTVHAYNLISSYKLPSKVLIRYKANYFRFGFHKKSGLVKLKNELIDKKYWSVASILGWVLYKKDK